MLRSIKRTLAGLISVSLITSMVSIMPTDLTKKVQAAEQPIYLDSNGKIRITPVPVPEENKNPAWPTQLEDEYWARANHIIDYYKGATSWGTSAGELEKNSYPKAMLTYWGNYLTDTTKANKAIEFLQKNDADATDTLYTNYVDYYWCFTNWWNMPKYFWFGKFANVLDPNYLQNKMYDGAVQWLKAGDPVEKKHPYPGYPNGGGVWGPDKTGVRTDWRNTDNLRAMRLVAVYLMAEETGNTVLMVKYKSLIREMVTTFYNLGFSEWDSENYASHTFTAWLNLYNYAKDPQLQKMGKAACDWVITSIALKYYGGGAGGPDKRDYGYANVVFGGYAANLMHLYFGDTPNEPTTPIEVEAHALLSSYRPPLAVVNLAKKNFAKPLEMINSKPQYNAWCSNYQEKPSAWETLYFGNTYEMGSCVAESELGDVQPFKLLARNSTRGVDYFLPYAGDKPNTMFTDEEIGQIKNLAIWLKPGTGTQYHIQAPATAVFEQDSGIWFYKMENTWVAVRPINLTYTGVQTGAELNQEYSKRSCYNNERFYNATSTNSSYTGYAMEVGDSTKSYEEFKAAVKASGSLDLSQLSVGTVTLNGSDGNTALKMTYNNSSNLPLVYRNGQAYNWTNDYQTYKPLGTTEGVTQNWKQDRTLRVEAGGEVFTQTVTAEGDVTWKNEASAGSNPLPTQNPLPTPTPGPAFQEVNGQIVMEAENYDKNTTVSGQVWSLENSSTNTYAKTGYSGNGYMVANYDNGDNYSAGYASTSPRMDYNIKVSNTGTYYLWFRSYGKDATGDSVHGGLDNTSTLGSEGIGTGIGSFQWRSTKFDGTRATIDILTAGNHTFNVWQREDGTILDKIILTKDVNFTPSDLGPNESTKQAESTPTPTPTPVPTPTPSATPVPTPVVTPTPMPANYVIDEDFLGYSAYYWSGLTGGQTGSGYLSPVYEEYTTNGLSAHNGALRIRGYHNGTSSTQGGIIFKSFDKINLTNGSWMSKAVHAGNANTNVRFAIRYNVNGIDKWAVTGQEIRTSSGKSTPIAGGGIFGNYTWYELDSDMITIDSTALANSTVLANANAAGIYGRFTGIYGADTMQIIDSLKVLTTSDAWTPTATPAATPTATPSATPSPTPTATPSAMPSSTPSATPTPTPTPTPASGSTLINDAFTSNTSASWTLAAASTLATIGTKEYIAPGGTVKGGYSGHNGLLRFKGNHTGTSSTQAGLLYNTFTQTDVSQGIFSTTGIHAGSAATVRLAIRYMDNGTMKWAISGESIRTSTGTSTPVAGGANLSTYSWYDLGSDLLTIGTTVNSQTVLNNANGAGVYCKMTGAWLADVMQQIDSFTLNRN